LPQVLVSFLVTATATVGTVLIGYFMDFLPGDYLTWADWGFLQSWTLCKGCRERSHAYEKGVTAPPNITCSHIDPEADSQRRRGLNAFILTLSDQQLVTGLAMMVAALAQRCQLSCYEFQIVSSLAFLSSTTHLASLAVLREYFQSNKQVRNIRVLGMVINLVLLIYTSIVAAAANAVTASARVQCVMDYIPPEMDFISLTFIITFLLLSYQQSIYRLYANAPKSNTLLKAQLRRYCCKHKGGPHLDEELFEQRYEAEVTQPGRNAYREYLWNQAIELDGNAGSGFYTKVKVKLLAVWAILGTLSSQKYRISCSASRMASHK
jgi:hypothetical protein